MMRAGDDRSENAHARADGAGADAVTRAPGTPGQTLHVISHTHWDREWYLTFQQFRLKLVHLVDKLLDILEQDPDYRFFMLDGQTIVLDDYLQMRPEREGILREHIEAGRILVGPWHVLSDMFLVSPESQVRNLLQGARTARRFGPRMPVGYCPDPFGNHGQVPQMLQGFGIGTACLWRGVGDLPTELWWESPDGSRVLLAHLRNGYGNGANLPVHDPEAFTEQLALEAERLREHSAVADHLLMLGTDHMEPSPHTSATLAHANAHLSGVRPVHSTLPAYFARVAEQVAELGADLPVLAGELRACSNAHLLPGVLSARMWIKQRNHASETLLERWAEPFSVFAERMITVDTALATPEAIASNRIRNVAPLLRRAWLILMENHPHDSICGCSIDQVHDEMRPRFDQADQIAEEISLQALQAISRAVDTTAEGALSGLVLFNPLSITRRDLVEVALKLPDEVEAFALVDGDGQSIAYDFVGSHHEELANLMLRPAELRDTIGGVSEGRIAGAALTSLTVDRVDGTVMIRAVLDEAGQPDVAQWHRGEAQIARYLADPTVAQFHVLAHTPRASTVRFVSPEVPALGWRTVWVRTLPAPEPASAATLNPLIRPLLPLGMRLAQSDLGSRVLAAVSRGPETRAPFRIEDDLFVVEVQRADGTLVITDRRSGAVHTGLNRFVDGGDAGDEYNFSPPERDSVHTARVVSIRAHRDRAVPTLEIAYDLRVPEQLSDDRRGRSSKQVTIPIVSHVTLPPGIGRIDVRTEVHNVARDHRLRVHFPAPIVVDQADHDSHFGVVRRPVGVPEKGVDWVEDPRPEVPQRAFTDISDGQVGLVIANRGLPEVEVLPGAGGDTTEIALTLLRCVGWLSRDDMPVRQGHAGPALETPGAQVPGTWSFDYSIIPHAGRWEQARDAAHAFQAGLRAVGTGIHAGEIPDSGSFLSTTPAEFVASAIKETEDGTGWLVRGHNSTSEPISLRMQPHRRFAHAARVNLAEDVIEVLGVARDGSVTVPVAGHQIVSVTFRD
jgi:alpha-mannosidase